MRCTCPATALWLSCICLALSCSEDGSGSAQPATTSATGGGNGDGTTNTLASTMQAATTQAASSSMTGGSTTMTTSAASSVSATVTSTGGAASGATLSTDSGSTTTMTTSSGGASTSSGGAGGASNVGGAGSIVTNGAGGTGSVAVHPDDAVEFGGHWYRLTEAEVGGAEAKALCEDLQGYLACVESEAEDDFLFTLAGTARPYIGLNNEDDANVWVWVNGSPVTYTNWQPGQPDYPESERWVKIAEDSMWDDGNIPSSFICEWES